MANKNNFFKKNPKYVKIEADTRTRYNTAKISDCLK